jgi:hypothetical protein
MEQVSELAGAAVAIEVPVGAFELRERLGEVWKDYNDQVASSTGLYHHHTHPALAGTLVVAISE